MNITLAYPWTDADGKKHDPDTALDLEDAVARQLVQDGKARLSDSATSPARKGRGRTAKTEKQEG